MNGLYNYELLLMDANLGNLGVLGPEFFFFSFCSLVYLQVLRCSFSFLCRTGKGSLIDFLSLLQ